MRMVLVTYLVTSLCAKINLTFRSWTELIQGVPQGSALRPILFNVYLNYSFFLFNNIDISSFANDTTTCL